MKSLTLSAAAMALVLTACGKEPPPAKPPASPPPQAAPAAPPPAPGGAMTQEEKERVAKEAIDKAKASARKGE